MAGNYARPRQVLDILKSLRIGSLSLEDMAESKSSENSDDPYAKVSQVVQS